MSAWGGVGLEGSRLRSVQGLQGRRQLRGRSVHC